MENIAGIAGPPRTRRRWLAPAGAAALMALGLPLQALYAAGARGGVRLTRNDAVEEPLGGRTWRGVLTNVTGAPLADVVVRIGFHDGHGDAVGAPVTARAARLAPGAGLDLQARLPAAAVGLSIHGLRWTVAERAVEAGGRGTWRFGDVQD
ncbi:FxLYD domain-containing protein [Brevundimonas sp.]|uniref:FxLYD domain-containing protein n=1 Tax=Brevundimonas sp. TaxID=1871086 RepID=UPI002D57FAA1|nr:FxLYD domain-containing protein [Brevundimonas sp.]HYC66703.1 FxLYD domain-containing protein [Brevundimonas sp.]